MERHYRTTALLLLTAAVAGLAGHALLYPFVSDDAYISFRYSYNFAQGNGLVFNPGERVEGYTNFLWTVLLGLLLKLQLRPDIMSRVLGVLFGAVVLLLLHVLSRIYRGGRPTGWDFVAALLLPACGTFAVWCSGGLETQMFAALGLGGMVLYLAEQGDRVRGRWSGLLFALAAMTRPEGALLFGLSGLHLLCANLLFRRRLIPTRAEWAWLAGFVVPLGAYIAWRYSYYGYPFPNTFYVKAGGDTGSSAIKWGLPYLYDFVKDNKLFGLPLLVPLFWPRTGWSSPRTGGQPTRGLRPGFVWSYFGLILVTYCAYVVVVGGDFMAMGRFFLPMLPIVAFFVQEGLREAVERPRAGRPHDSWRPAVMIPLTALLLAAAVTNSVFLHRAAQKPGYYRWGLDSIGYLKTFADDRVLVGRWLRKNLPPDTYLAVGGAGAIVYASRMKALDTFGLNDSWIAHELPRTGDRPGHTKSAPEHYILQQKPDLMCHQAKHQDWKYRPSPEEAEEWARKGYHWVCIAPRGLRPSNYCCLKRRDRKLGPWPAEV